jgi:tRNA-specific 2-thiouridylase
MSLLVVAMSGGVDSSVAAALMLAEGHEVLGVTMVTVPPPGSLLPLTEQVREAGRVCGHLGIPHQVLDLRESFAFEVIGNFLEEYRRGRTPNPCSRCNSRIKFGVFLEKVQALGAETLVTGHYARLRTDPETGRVRLLRGLDPRKDQSYFLAGLRQDQLAAACFPIGGFPKKRVREIAGELGLPVVEKADSQDLCFVSARGKEAFLRKSLGPGSPGPILDQTGRFLGTHPGLESFTLGQRRGLGVCGSERLYVLELDVARNALILGREESLLHQEMEVGEMNWLIEEPVRRARVQFRSTSRGDMAALTLLPDGRVRVRFDHPQRALCPGQCAVFYRRDEVLGGGLIVRAGAGGETP